MKKCARETEETPQQIISQSVALLSEQAAVAMPLIHHIRRDIRHQRKRAGNPLAVPQDKDFDIPPVLKWKQSLNHFTSWSWPSTRASTLLPSRQQMMNKEYCPRLPQQGQIAVSPWPRPQQQYVKKLFFKKTPNYRLYVTQNGSFKNHQPTMRLCQPCTTL